ncbi:MAG: hypothetical protein NPIRA03_13260 [Nitrospirales bacterium]|nr:MAG: hypothetical protein NPIRA03_13260 [Nitrospirales bacterium]
MKKRILGAAISFVVLGGFVAGPEGKNLIGATATAASCSDLPGVEACILIKPGGIVDIVPGKDKNGKVIKFRKPKKQGEGKPDAPKPGTTKDRKDLPADLEDDITTENFLENHVTVYGDKTCANVNGIWYCW